MDEMKIAGTVCGSSIALILLAYGVLKCRRFLKKRKASCERWKQWTEVKKWEEMQGDEHESNQVEGFLNIEWEDLQVEAAIGKGSFGFVRKARWNDTDVAIKLIDPKEGLQQVQKVRNIMSLLRPHPNVLRIIGECVSDKGQLGLVMPFYPLGSVKDHLYGMHKKRKGLDLDLVEKLFIIFDICAGLRQMHSCGILHLDVAARNVLLYRDKERIHACLSDFNMSKIEATAKKTASKEIRGPLKWMCPELLKAGTFTKKCDVFAFGITAWEILHEMPPWKQYSPLEAAKRTLNKERLGFHLPQCCQTRNWTRMGTSLHPRFSTSHINETPLMNFSTLLDETLSAGEDIHRFNTLDSIATNPTHDAKKSTDRVIVQKLCGEVKKCWEHEPEDRPGIHEVYDFLIELFDLLFSIDLIPYDEHHDEGHGEDYQTIRFSQLEEDL